MRARATGKASILRGTTTDAYDDLVDTDDITAVVATNVSYAVFESTKRTYLPAEGATRIIRSYAGRVGYETVIQKGDRLKDEATGVVYIVTEIPDPISPAYKPDRLLELKKTV
jgi:hypothetical protein